MQNLTSTIIATFMISQVSAITLNNAYKNGVVQIHSTHIENKQASEIDLA